MPADRPMLVELQWVHDCFCIDCVERVQDGRISLVSPLAHGQGFATGLYEIEAGEGVGALVSQLSGNSLVKQVSVIEKNERKALVYLRSRPDSLLIETISRTGCVPLEPSLTKNGVDSSVIYVPSEAELKTLYGTLRDNYEVKLLSKKYVRPGGGLKQSAYMGLKELLDFKSLASNFSPRQLELFSYASRKGYFDSPKKISIREIADALGLKPATASEHLRKAQAKAMPLVAQIMQNLR